MKPSTLITLVYRQFLLNEMLIISVVWHVDDNAMGQGHLTNLSGHSNCTSELDMSPSNASTSQCTSSGNISCKDRNSEIALLRRWPSGSHRIKSEDSHCRGLGQVFPSRSSTPSGFVFWEHVSLYVSSLLVHERYYSRRQGKFTCKFFKKVFLFYCGRSFLYPPQSSGGKKPTNPANPANLTEQKINYATIFRLVQSRQIYLTPRYWTSNLELSFIESKTTKRLEQDPVRRIVTFNMFVTFNSALLIP